jgi:hypothetical protein
MSLPALHLEDSRPAADPALPEFEVSPPLSRLGVLAVVVVFAVSALVWAAIGWALVALLG